MNEDKIKVGEKISLNSDISFCFVVVIFFLLLRVAGFVFVDRRRVFGSDARDTWCLRHWDRDRVNASRRSGRGRTRAERENIRRVEARAKYKRCLRRGPGAARLGQLERTPSCSSEESFALVLPTEGSRAPPPSPFPSPSLRYSHTLFPCVSSRSIVVVHNKNHLYYRRAGSNRKR